MALEGRGPPINLEEVMSELADNAKSKGRNVFLFGVVVMILGILAMLAPMVTGFSVTVLLGILVIGAGIARMFWAFDADGFGKGLLAFALGGLTLVAGGILIAKPLVAASVLTILLASYFLIDGIFEIVAAFQIKPEGWGWLLFAGCVSVLLAIMLWWQFPLSGPWAMGILIGIKLFLVGILMMTVGRRVRQVGKKVDKLTESRA